MKSITTLALAGSLLFGPGARADEIDSYVREQMSKQHIAGLSLAVIQKGRIVKTAGYGLANVELNVKASPQTVYEIGSMTKQFTAMCILILAREGKLNLDDPVSKHLEGTPKTWEKITIRHCLTHTAGLKDYLGLSDFGLTKNIKKSDFIGLAGKHTLDYQPGEGWMYSNTGYYLAGLIIEKLSGKTYEEFLRERIFKPIGMTHTYLHDINEVVPNRASGYMWLTKEKERNTPAMGANEPFSAGMILSTVLDMAKWDAAIAAAKLVPAADMEQLWSRVKFNSGRTYPYGMGWFLGEQNGHKLVMHGGNTIGFSSDILRCPDEKLSVIILTNRSGINPEGICRRVAGLCDPNLRSATVAETQDSDPQATVRLTRLLRSAADNKPESEAYTPEMWAMLSTQRGTALKMQLTSLGKKLDSLAFVDRKTADGEIETRYRLYLKPDKTGDKPIEGPVLMFVFAPDGKLARLEAGE